MASALISGQTSGYTVDFLLSQNNLLILTVAVTAVIALVLPSILKGKTKTLSVNQAVQLINQQNGLFVDVRAADLFKAASIAQSRSLPTADIATRHNSLPKDRPLIVVCERGRNSIAAASKLRKLGFDNVFSLDGGIQAWAQAGMPLSRKS